MSHCLSVCLSVCRTRGLCRNGQLMYHHFLEDLLLDPSFQSSASALRCPVILHQTVVSTEQTLPFLAMLLRITGGVLISGVRTGNAGNLQRATQETLY